MLWEICDGSVSAGGTPVLTHFSFEIHGTEKIGIVGRNGSGKTTLLRLLAGELELETHPSNPASGMKMARAFRIGFLSQNIRTELSMKLEDYALQDLAAADRFSPERYQYECEFDRMLTGLGLQKEDKAREIRTFSGGEQTRIALIRILLDAPDVLLLDEPTNHLDASALEWLEEELIRYPGAVVMVSHDRYFLDRTVRVIYELERGRATRYPGNYSDYRKEKAAAYEKQLGAWRRQQEEIRRLNDLIVRFRNKPRKAAFARSRKKILERMEKIEKPLPDQAKIHTEKIHPASGCAKWVFSGEDLIIGYDYPLHRLTFRMPRGGKWAVIGENGSGKSTLLKTLAGQIPKISGRLSVGDGVTIGYFDQQSAGIRSEKPLMEWFRDLYPQMTDQEIRDYLGGYLFHGVDLGKAVSSLSGGEKARLSLAAILYARPNVLLLDEPTNHMDIPARETIESILMCYQGTILLVTHDRYLIQKTASSLLILEKNREEVFFYPFDYVHYREHRQTAVRAMSAERTLEEQALIEGLQKVPRGSRLMGREIPVQTSSWEWHLERMEEAMEEAADAYLRSLWEEDEPPREERLASWTASCLKWYETWMEMNN